MLGTSNSYVNSIYRKDFQVFLILAYLAPQLVVQV
jgi:hypothetical protein